MENKQAIIYVRASTNQTRQSNSHALQIKSCEDFCNRNKYTVVKVFTEYASGTLDERPVFNEAIKYAQDNDTGYELLFNVSYHCYLCSTLYCTG